MRKSLVREVYRVNQSTWVIRLRGFVKEVKQRHLHVLIILYIKYKIFGSR